MSRAESNVLVDNWFERRSLALDLVWMAAFSLLTASLAQLRIPLPFTPVPLTGQTFAVLLSGAALGRRRAFLSQALYLLEGAAGLPVLVEAPHTLRTFWGRRAAIFGAIRLWRGSSAGWSSVEPAAALGNWRWPWLFRTS